MEKDDENANTSQYILPSEDVFSCVRENDTVLCRESELISMVKYSKNAVLMRIIKLVREYETARTESDFALMKILFRELHSAREEFALSEGYEDYGSFVLENELKISRDHLFSLMDEVREKYFGEEAVNIPDIKWADSPSDSFEKIRELFSRIPFLGEYLEKLVEKGNVNICAQADYTLLTEEGDLPVINVSLRGDITDICRFSHELGHAYGIYLSENIPDVITSEIHANLTEAVIYPYVAQMCGQTLPFRHIWQKKRSLLKACAVTEYELEVYKNGPKNAGKVWRQMHEKYGISSGEDGYLTYSHITGFPFYNVSYIIAIIYTLREYKNLSTDKYHRLMRETSVGKIFPQESIL